MESSQRAQSEIAEFDGKIRDETGSGTGLRDSFANRVPQMGVPRWYASLGKRTHTAALRAIDLEMEILTDRVQKLEDRP